MNPDALWPHEPVSRHARNPTGRDFVVGDVHGTSAVVERALKSLRFAPDRGPRSADALEWLQEGRILAVRGNHEQWMVNSLVIERGRLRMSGYCADWLDNGGGWFWGWHEDEDGNRVIHDVDHRDRREDWLAALRTMPPRAHDRDRRRHSRDRAHTVRGVRRLEPPRDAATRAPQRAPHAGTPIRPGIRPGARGHALAAATHHTNGS